jgi:hypothetical protein
MVPKSVVDEINDGNITDDEFLIVAREFAKSVSEKANMLFKRKDKYDDYIIGYYKVETM